MRIRIYLSISIIMGCLTCAPVIANNAIQPPTPPPAAKTGLPAALNVSSLFAEGASDAKVAMIEFTDFECENCGEYARSIYPRIFTDYIETGKIRYFHWDFPSPQHPHSLIAARAAHCAGEQGRFWQMHDNLFSFQYSLTSKEIANRAVGLGLDDKLFRQCLFSDKYANDIVNSLTKARELGVVGTPTFYIGRLDSTGSVVKVEKAILGSKQYDDFKTSIDSILTGAPASTGKPNPGNTSNKAATPPLASTHKDTPPPPGVAADIDGHTISLADVDKFTMRKFGSEMLDIMIDAYLVDREGKRLNIDVSQAEIDSQVQAIADGIKPNTLEEGLKAHHQTLAELQSDIRHRLLGLKLAAIGIKPGHYVHAYVILVKPANGVSVNQMDPEALATIKTIRDKYKTGAKFDDLVKQYSQDQSTKDRNGDLGVLFDGAPYDGALVDAALALKQGEVTEKPVVTPLGYYLIEARSTDEKHPAAEDKLYEEAKWHYEMYQGNMNYFNYMRSLRAKSAVKTYLKD